MKNIVRGDNLCMVMWKGREFAFLVWLIILMEETDFNV